MIRDVLTQAAQQHEDRAADQFRALEHVVKQGVAKAFGGGGKTKQRR